jgi:hypothetical protein
MMYNKKEMFVLPGGTMREEIRLGNEALAHNDLDRARQYFQQLLSQGGTVLQERIAENRLREIREKTEALQHPVPAKPRLRRKTTEGKKATPDDPPSRVIRPPDRPIVVIRKH